MKVFVAIVLCLGLAAALPLTVLNEGDSFPHPDCHSVWKAGHRTNGTYRLNINGTHHEAPCAFYAHFAFTIFLNRIDDSVSWNQNYKTYIAGFGNPLHDYFSGLENLHILTRSGRNGLDIRFMDWNNKELFYTYSTFAVGDYYSGYRLTVTGHRTGNVGPDMDNNNGRQFHTYDHPDVYNCASHLRAGWWYNYDHVTNICTRTLPTGYYFNRYHCCPSAASNGILWGSYKGGHYSLKRFAMSIRHDLYL